MTRLDRYIATLLLAAMALVVATLLGLTSLFAVVDELREDIPGYGFLQALTYVGFSTARRVEEILPYGIFIGALVGLGTLARHSELTVMRASGMSVARLFVAAATPAALLLVSSVFVAEVLAPRGEEAAEAAKARVRQVSSTIHLSRGGHWYREGGAFVNVDALAADGRLVNVRQWVLDDERRLVAVTNAASATYDAAGGRWRLADVQTTEFGRDDTRVRVEASRDWSIRANPELLGTSVLVDPRRLSLRDLDRQIEYMKREALDTATYALAFWTKLLQPLSILALTALAVAFVVGPLREVGMGTRLAAGVLVCLLFKYLQDLFAPIAMVYALPAAIAVAMPIALCWIAAWIGWRRAA